MRGEGLKEAFSTAIAEANRKQVQSWYVTLGRIVPYYGGPEEGGWWGEDFVPEEFAVFSTEEEAWAVHDEIRATAAKLTELSKKSFGDRCNAEIEWLEARNLPDDYLPEVDGPDRWCVTVSNEAPEARYGSRHYE